MLNKDDQARETPGDAERRERLGVTNNKLRHLQAPQSSRDGQAAVRDSPKKNQSQLRRLHHKRRPVLPSQNVCLRQTRTHLRHRTAEVVPGFQATHGPADLGIINVRLPPNIHVSFKNHARLRIMPET